MTVLVAYASARWSTNGIAEEIGDRLMKAGVKAFVRPMAEVESLTLYDAVVLGSAVHHAAWLPQGTRFLTRHQTELESRPVWLFSVSALGNTTKESQAVARARELPRFRAHRDFTGATARGQWSRARDLLLLVCGGWPTHHRDWRDVNEWATGIAAQVLALEWAKERTRLRLVPSPPSTSGRAR